MEKQHKPNSLIGKFAPRLKRDFAESLFMVGRTNGESSAQRLRDGDSELPMRGVIRSRRSPRSAICIAEIFTERERDHGRWFRLLSVVIMANRHWTSACDH